MDTEYLKTFLLLANLKNFTQTAERLFIAQSTVTNRIIELEEEIGKKLFIRDRKSVTLTKEGILFLKYAKRIVELEESSIQEINSLKFYNDVLRIGSTNVIYEAYLSQGIHDFLKNNDDISVKITLGHSLDLLQMLKDEILDIVYSFIPLSKKGYQCSHFHTDELVLVTSPLNSRYPSGIRKEELSQINYLFCNFPFQEVSLSIRELFPQFYQFQLEIDNSSKLIQYLTDGMGYSFLPESFVKPYIKDGLLTSIPLLDFKAPQMRFYCSYRTRTEVVSKFIGNKKY